MLRLVIDLYSLIVLARVVVSWVQLSPYHPVVQFLDRVTEPVLAPIRKVLPPFGGLDLSPMLLLLGLRLLTQLF